MTKHLEELYRRLSNTMLFLEQAEAIYELHSYIFEYEEWRLKTEERLCEVFAITIEMEDLMSPSYDCEENEFLEKMQELLVRFKKFKLSEIESWKVIRMIEWRVIIV